MIIYIYIYAPRYIAEFNKNDNKPLLHVLKVTNYFRPAPRVSQPDWQSECDTKPSVLHICPTQKDKRQKHGN